eukprot:2647416-Prymnesium_polylepis.1
MRGRRASEHSFLCVAGGLLVVHAVRFVQKTAAVWVTCALCLVASHQNSGKPSSVLLAIFNARFTSADGKLNETECHSKAVL